MTGYQAVIGILAALRHRDLTGVGQHVEVDMLSVVLDTQLQEYVTYLNTGRQPERTEEWSAHSFIPAPYGVYKTYDGWLALAMTELPNGEAKPCMAGFVRAAGMVSTGAPRPCCWRAKPRSCPVSVGEESVGLVG